MSQDKLLPCPFCGNEVRFTREAKAFQPNYVGEIGHIICSKCFARAHGSMKTENECIKAWNTRNNQELVPLDLEDSINKIETLVGEIRGTNFYVSRKEYLDNLIDEANEWIEELKSGKFGTPAVNNQGLIPLDEDKLRECVYKSLMDYKGNYYDAINEVEFLARLDFMIKAVIFKFGTPSPRRVSVEEIYKIIDECAINHIGELAKVNKLVVTLTIVNHLNGDKS